MATLHIDKIIAEKVNQDDLIRLLETVIDEEMQRPEAEMNCDLIDQCVDALLEMRQDRDHLAVMVPLMQDKAFLHLIQRKAGNTARLNGAARGALIAAAILASTISVNAMVDAAFDYNILEHIGKAISASVLGPEIIGGEDDVDEPTTVPGATDKSEPTTVPERTTANANGETATRQPEQTTTAAAVTQPTTTTPTTTEREQESTTKKVTGDNVHHKPTQPDRPEETTKAVHVIGFNAQLDESFKSHYIYGEQLSYDGLTLTADWSDGTTKPVALKNCTYTTQVNMNRTADVTLNILYKGFLVEIPITVRPNEETRESTICQTDRYDYLLCKAGAYITAYRGTAARLTCDTVEGNRIFAIADEVFRKHTELTTVELPYVTYVGAKAFAGCTALKVLELPDTVTNLGDHVFENCTALASVLLSGGLTALPTYAFRNCTALTGVVVPNSVATFNPGAFADCKALKEVYIGSQSTRYVQLGTNRTHVFARCPALTVYTMAGSDAAVYAKTRNIPTELYTDADAFADLCAMKRDIYAGYLGFCTDGHGDIQWLTVYAADCTHDGYAIGVCEYCSAILEERHTTATGHNYVVSETPAADGRDGVRITTCQNCGDSSYTVLPGSGTAVEETHTVTGTVVLAADRAATKGTHAAIGADILLNGYTLATTDEKGNFSLQLKSGTYALTVRYAYGFSRTLYVVVSDRDLQCGSVPVIGCDWNKDGKIDDQDYYMFKLIFGTHQGQAGYLSYVDMNHDGMINTRDMIFVERCMGLQAGSFAYTPLVIR